MDKLAKEELQKYEKIWGAFPEYREESPADYLIPVFLSHFENQIKPNDSHLDFGCGTGRSALPLLSARMDVHLVDISENCLDPDIFLLQLKKTIHFTQGCLWDLPSQLKPAKWITCMDVLEHLPQDKVDEALRGMSIRMTQGGFFSIYLQDEQFGQKVGQKLHLTVQPASWWIKRISKYFKIDQEFPTDEKTLVLALGKKSTVTQEAS